MKYFVVTVGLFLCLSLRVSSQNYRVSKVFGNVSYNGKLLVKDNVITGLNKLTASSANAAIRLVSAATGSVVINFVHGKKVKDADKPEKSEFYELVVQEYINKYTTFKNTQTMGVPEFDWYNFFYQYPDTLNRRMLIVEGEKIPLQSQVFKTTRPFQILAATFTVKIDSTVHELPVQQDSIVFPAAAFAGRESFYLDIYIAYKNNKGENKTSKVTKYPVQAFYLTAEQLKALIALFHDNLNDGYKDAQDAKNDLYSYLEFNYGRFYDPLMAKQIKQVFK